MKHKCGYEDCFNCPYYDCIVNGTDPADPNVSDYLQKPKQSEEEIKAKKREYMRTKYKKRKVAA